MKKLIILAMLIFCIPFCHAQDMWFYNSKYIILDVGLSTGIDVVTTSPNPEIEFITSNISFFPKSYPNQQIISKDFIPDPSFVDDSAIFEWNHPGRGRLDILMDSRVRIDDNPIKILKKISFPLDDIPDEIKIYTQPAEIIDINDDTISAASEIASGKDDLVEVVDSVAVWVNTNIEYNFSTITAEASQKASWVLDNKEGVCDELTSLFIAMLRSLGIPARFVAGVSYTNSPEFTQKWGPHGWAEVYFPDYGWIPYDVTYGEYGWIDPSHVISKISEDAGKVTSTYQWRAEAGVSLSLDDLNTDVDVVEIGADRASDVSLSMDILDDEIGFGSYNLITASVMNLKSYYVSEDIYISRTNRINNIDGIKKHVLLRPGEIKDVYWIVQVDDDLDRDYIYTFPIQVYTLENSTVNSEFKSLIDGKEHSYESIEDIVSTITETNGHAYSRNVAIVCSLNKSEYYVYEKPDLTCTIRNQGNIFLKNLRACLQDECKETHLGITQAKEFVFRIRKIEPGDNELLFTINNEQISSNELIRFTGFDEPKLDITDLEYPFKVKYSTNFNIDFILDKKSDSSPKNVKVSINGAGINKEFSYGELYDDVVYEINLKGRDLNIGDNKITISADYLDNNGRKYSASETINVALVDVNVFQKLMLYLRNLFR